MIFWRTKTERGNLHVAVIADFYSRFVVIFPLPDLTSATLIQQFYQNVICSFGTVHRIVSDNGPSLVSKDFQEFCDHFNIEHQFNTALHPQSSGTIERANRTILNILRTIISEDQLSWDLCLKSIQSQINSTPAYATGHSPFLLQYGRIPRQPWNKELSDPFENCLQVRQHFLQILDKQFRAEAIAKDHLQKTRAKMKERYDLNAKKTMASKDIKAADPVFHPIKAIIDIYEAKRLKCSI